MFIDTVIHVDMILWFPLPGADKAVIDEAVKTLLQLKADYKTLTGVDLAAGGSSKKSKKSAKAAAPASVWQFCRSIRNWAFAHKTVWITNRFNYKLYIGAHR